MYCAVTPAFVFTLANRACQEPKRGSKPLAPNLRWVPLRSVSAECKLSISSPRVRPSTGYQTTPSAVSDRAASRRSPLLMHAPANAQAELRPGAPWCRPAEDRSPIGRELCRYQQAARTHSKVSELFSVDQLRASVSTVIRSCLIHFLQGGPKSLPTAPEREWSQSARQRRQDR